MCAALVAAPGDADMMSSQIPKRSDPESLIVVRSDDGVLSYWLRVTQLGLCVRRERKQARCHARFVHTALFRDSKCFLRWCEADSVRFDYPIVFSAVKRQGGALLESLEGSVQRQCANEGR